jgi:predicted  nucleic acid-binding Zn-ribbon protein
MEAAEAAGDAVQEASAKVEEARRLSAAEEPALNEELSSSREELAEVEVERDQVWAQVPVTAQAAYTRIRVQPAVAQVVRNQCQACHVTVTSSGMQNLRKGDILVNCENCGRILVPA